MPRHDFHDFAFVEKFLLKNVKINYFFRKSCYDMLSAFSLFHVVKKLIASEFQLIL